MKRAVLSAVFVLTLATPLFAQESPSESLIRGQSQLLSQIMSLQIDQNAMMRTIMGALVSLNNEVRMNNVLLCDSRTRRLDKLVNRLCTAIRMEYEAVQDVLNAPPKVKGDKS